MSERRWHECGVGCGSSITSSQVLSDAPIGRIMEELRRRGVDRIDVKKRIVVSSVTGDAGGDVLET